MMVPCAHAALSLFTVCSVTFSVGCGRVSPPPDLVVINGPEPESLDPGVCSGQSDLRVAGALFDGLTRLDPKTAKASPSIAESWEISKDGRVYLFHIRPAARWSNGESITAEDFVYSWRLSSSIFARFRPLRLCIARPSRPTAIAGSWPGLSRPAAVTRSRNGT
ncbi:MAG: hypothetical protein HY299_04000 [Verrucomicrobia bacterium]|nr:hypothetical protein [Verrucomicrobiota bacterium]